MPDAHQISKSDTILIGFPIHPALTKKSEENKTVLQIK